MCWCATQSRSRESSFDEFGLIGNEQSIVDTVAANEGDVSIPKWGSP